jgi:toxin ParE1/3/4
VDPVLDRGTSGADSGNEHAVIVWSRRAVLDLAHLRVEIGHNSPAAAKRMALRITSPVETLLAEHPLSGRPGRVTGTRELVITRTPYVVAYRVDKQGATILAALHGHRDRPDML